MEKPFTIATLISSYKSVQDIYQQVARRGSIYFSEQVDLTRFYNDYREVPVFEKMMVDVLTQNAPANSSLLINRLRSIIKDLLGNYEANKTLFDAIDTAATTQQIARQYDIAIKDQQYRTRQYSNELNDINNQLDAIGYNGSSLETESYLYNQKDTVKKLYEEEKEKLASLYELQQEAWQLAAQNNKSRFKEIYDLSTVFYAILENYFEKSAPISALEEKASLSHQKNTPYFEMSIVGAVHRQCNGHQFEPISEIALYHVLNLEPSEAHLVIRSGEKTRVCYLIYKLYDSIKTPLKNEWREHILEILEIKESFYFAKYKEPVSELPSRRSENFAENINSIFL